jgi:PD-(D/E)XK nuclease superfamily
MTNETPTQPPAPSPFLPNTKVQFAWDSTSLGLIKTCPRLYQYTMLDGWGSAEESVHLRFGIEYHQALQDYDLSRAEGIPHDDAVFDVVRELLIRTHGWVTDPESRAGKYKNRESLVRTVIWYLENFREDTCETYIMANGKPAVELSFRFELAFGPADGQPYVLCGHLDRVVRFNDDLFIMDHKTTTSTPGQYYFAQYEPNNQMTLYTLASQIVLDAPVKGVIITAAQILMDSARFVRGFTFRTKDQVEEWLADASRWFNIAEWYAANDYWPQNDTACDKFGGCRFRSVCSKSPSVREIYLKSNFTKQEPEARWNPLKSR